MPNNELKLYYNLGKLTDVNKLITDDFVTTATLALFSFYMDTLGDNKLAFTSNFMARWEEAIIAQKEREINTLAHKGETMQDMITGGYLSSQEDLNLFKQEVSKIKKVLFEALMK